MKYKLIGSAASLEQLAGLISKFYCSPNIRLVGFVDLFEVHNSSGPIEGVRVIKKGNRYRFEVETN